MIKTGQKGILIPLGNSFFKRKHKGMVCMRNRASLVYFIGVACILCGLSYRFAFFKLNMNVPNSRQVNEGIFVDAFLLLGGKGIFFLVLLMIWVGFYHFFGKRNGQIFHMAFLLVLVFLLFYWMHEMKQVLQYVSTNETILQMGSGFFLVCIGFMLIFLRLLWERKQF